MSRFEIEAGKQIHCRELNTGRGYSGFFLFDHTSISTEIYSYDNNFSLNTDEPIFLRAKNNRIISLYSNIIKSQFEYSRGISPRRMVYEQTILSNIAIIGPEIWDKNDKIKRVTFSVNHSKGILRNNAKINELTNRSPDNSFILLSETINDITIRIYYTIKYSKDFNTIADFDTRFELEFDNGTNLIEYPDYVHCLVQFLSFSRGICLRPSDIRICRLSNEDVYSVQYTWWETSIDDDDLIEGRSLVTARNDQELASLRGSISIWFKRYVNWKEANELMVGYLNFRGSISPDRLLAVYKWFEEIPLSCSQNSISEEDINVISNVAAEKALELGYDATIKNRIIGALRPIKTESYRARFLRLLEMVKGKLGASVLDDKVITHLMNAREFRGQSAHGHLNPLDTETTESKFVDSIYAMEALCYLLTACDLPISQAGLQRINSHPLARDYPYSI